MKHLISILDSIRINELKRSGHFSNRTSSQYSSTPVSDESRIVEYEPGSRPFGWIIDSFYEVDSTGNPTGLTGISIDSLANKTSFSKEKLKKIITMGLTELTNQKWIDDFVPVDHAQYRSVKLGRIGLSIGGKVYCPVYEFPYSHKKGDVAWLIVREKETATTIKFFPLNTTPDDLLKDAVQSVNSDNYRYRKEENVTRFLLGVPKATKRADVTVDMLRSNYRIDDVPDQRKFFLIMASSVDSDETLANSVKRAFGSDVEIKAKERIAHKGDDAERARAEHGKYLSLEPGSVFMYKNIDPNNKNLEQDKFTPITVLAVKKITDRAKEIEVRNQKTGRTFIMKIKPGDTIKLTRPNKEGTSIPHTARVEVTDNTPQNKKRMAVTWLDQAEE